jgi:hypothetical protein
LPAAAAGRYALGVVQPYPRSVAIQPADSSKPTRRYQIRPSSVQADAAKLYSSLNDEQLAAVTAPPGPVLLIAAAGSGKTRVVTYRVCHLVAQGTSPERILLLTFTNKAAHEMLERVRAIGSVDPTAIVGGTFHRVAHRMLRKHADRVGFQRDFTLLDQEDARDPHGPDQPPALEQRIAEASSPDSALLALPEQQRRYIEQTVRRCAEMFVRSSSRCRRP